MADDKPLVETIQDLEDWALAINQTVQITCRVKTRPTWLVRIARPGVESSKLSYRQAVSDDLQEALDDCLEAWIKDEEALNAGRRPGTDVDNL